jgi:nucleoside-diphosphate-sugar epimerase
MKRTLIVGCGYLGLAVGRILVSRGHSVWGLRRNLDSAADLIGAGIQPVACDITQPEALALLAERFDWVVNTVSSSKGGVGEYRSVYLNGTRNLMDWMRGQSIQKYVYTSSTSVYGQVDGSIVDEDSPTEPSTETGRLLVETERLILDFAKAQIPGVVLRVAGIYGDGRGHLFHQTVAGEARITGDGSRWINMVHRDDAASAIVAALESGNPGSVYNCVDDQPVRQKDFLQWLAQELGKSSPPAVSEEGTSVRKRGITHKQVSNRKLRLDLRWCPRFPTYKEGYAGMIQHFRETASQKATAVT